MAPPNPQMTSCPDDESLLNFALANGAQSTVERHIHQCAQCATEVARVQARIALADQLPMRVPPALLRRAQAELPDPVPTPQLVAKPWHQRLRDALTQWRWAALAPVAAAAAVLFIVSSPQLRKDAAPQVELTRDVEVHQPARLTRAGTLRQEPRGGAAVVRELARGDNVVLFQRDAGWYQVALSDGTKGWIEVDAFE